MPAGGVLKFKYSMWGENIGTLKVLAGVQEVLSMSGQQSGSQGEWKDAVVNLSPGASVELSIVGVTAYGWRGDIAIDAVTIETASLASTTGASSVLTLVSHCSFEAAETDNFCGEWSQDDADKFDWKRMIGLTPSGTTGPSKASDGEQYLFIESSAPRRNGDAAALKSKSLPLPGGGLLTFKYSMWGDGIGSLKVLLSDTEVWSQSGKKSTSADDWKTADIQISPRAAAEIKIVATVGTWSGDIAIDDVTVKALSR
jgi:hypothetical protein